MAQWTGVGVGGRRGAKWLLEGSRLDLGTDVLDRLGPMWRGSPGSSPRAWCVGHHPHVVLQHYTKHVRLEAVLRNHKHVSGGN